MVDLSVNKGKLQLKNPVTTASGTFGYGGEYTDFYPLENLGAITVKGISGNPENGNPMPRHCEVKSGILNAVGLQNPGVKEFINSKDYLPFLRKENATVIVNIWGKTIEEYKQVAARLNEEDGIKALEINISCPNIKAGGIAFGTDLKQAYNVVSEVRKVTNLPLITKLSPNVSKISDFAKAVVDAGSDIISLINTVPGMSIDIETQKPRLANISGGLSGPAIKPIATKLIYDVSNAVDIPIIGMGGIMSGEDAIEFILAGADAVSIGTGIFSNPYLPINVLQDIKNYLEKYNYSSLSEITGQLKI